MIKIGTSGFRGIDGKNFDSNVLGDLEYESVKQLYVGSLWYLIKLKDKDSTEEAVDYLINLDTLDKVEYDYLMGADGEIESVDASANTYINEHKEN